MNHSVLSLVSAVAFIVIPCSSGFSAPSLYNNRHAPLSTRHLKLFSAPSAAVLPEGISKKIVQDGTGSAVRVGDVVNVKYSCFLPPISGEERLLSLKPFAKSNEQKLIVGEGIMIDGWELAIQTMKGGERCILRIRDPKYAYGSTGVPPFVPPDSEIQIDLEILSVEAGVDLGTVASEDPLKPRTPTSIAEAYATRKELKILEEASAQNTQGLDAILSKIKSSYFFGFFEGETGQVAPWYLRPSITFPLAFIILGLAFYISYTQGAITERGLPVKDELDEIILPGTLVSLLNTF